MLTRDADHLEFFPRKDAPRLLEGHPLTTVPKAIGCLLIIDVITVDIHVRPKVSKNYHVLHIFKVSRTVHQL